MRPHPDAESYIRARITLADERRAIYDALNEEEPEPQRYPAGDSVWGPPWGFASLGSYYRQNRPGFVWPKRKKL